MAQILFITHRIPYPPNKGEKIRAFQMIQNLKKLGHQVCSAFPIDDSADLSHTHQLKNFVDKIICPDKSISRFKKIVQGLASLLTDQPLTKGLGYSYELEELLKSDNMNYDLVIFYSAVSYLYAPLINFKRSMCDFVDMDSYKWFEYSQSSSFPMSLIYAREYKLMKQVEVAIANSVDLSLFVTDAEKNLFLSQNKHVSFEKPIESLECSIDHNRFNPEFSFPNPFLPQHRDALNFVMTGAMDYKPNYDGAIFFINEVLPYISQLTNKKITFYCVGRTPTKKLLKFHNPDANVVITGSVDDVRPYINHAFACIAPLFIGRGIQNKVLEAMSMQKTCFISQNAFEGLDVQDNKHVIVCHDVHEWRSKIANMIENPQRVHQIAKAASVHVQERYSNLIITEKLQAILAPLLD